MLHPHQRHIDLCNAALESVRLLIPEKLYRDVYDYFNRHNEWGLGVEILIDQIIEYEIKITPDQFAKIHEAMSSMGLAETELVKSLREEVVA